MLRSALIRVVYTGLMFFAGLILSNLALPEGFGTISLIILNASLFSLVTGFGADSLILQRVSNRKWKQEEATYFMWQTMAFQLFLFLTLELAFLLIGHRTLLSAHGGWLYFSFDLLYFTGLIFTEKISALLYSLQKARALNLLLCFLAVLYLVVLLVGYAGFRTSGTTILFVFVLQSFVQGLLLLVYLGKQSGLKVQRVPKQQVLEAFKTSSIVMLTNVIQLFAYRIDFWLLAYYYSGYEVGLYAQANKFANLIWILPNVFAQLLIPRFSSLCKADVPKLVGFGIASNLLIVLATIFCANVLYFHYLNAAYQVGLSAFYTMLPGYFCWAGVIYLSAYFFWAGKFMYNLVGSSLCLLIILVVDLWLIPAHGINGAALANTVTYTTLFFLYLFMATYKFGFRWSELIWLRKTDFLRILKFVTS